MNILQAKQIPITEIVLHLGGIYAKQIRDECWYHSPFRPEEHTASFKVNLTKNTWYDFGRGEGGTLVDLWLDFHQRSRTDREALKWTLEELGRFQGGKPTQSRDSNAPAPKIDPTSHPSEASSPRFEWIKAPARIWHNGLLQEIDRRGIPTEIAMKYLKQGYFQDIETGKKLNGFAFANDLGGYEVSVPNPQRGVSFKTAIGGKGISTLALTEATSLQVFEGFWDFLSYMAYHQTTSPTKEVVVLNSLAFVSELANALLQRPTPLKEISFFHDNDPAGEQAVERLKTLLSPLPIEVHSMGHHYVGYKDVNAWWMAKRQSEGISQKPSLQ